MYNLFIFVYVFMCFCLYIYLIFYKFIYLYMLLKLYSLIYLIYWIYFISLLIYLIYLFIYQFIHLLNYFFLWRNSPTRAQTDSLLRFRNYTQLDTLHSVGRLWTRDRSIAETPTWHHTTLTRYRHSCPPAVFKPAMSASERPKTYALEIYLIYVLFI